MTPTLEPTDKLDATSSPTPSEAAGEAVANGPEGGPVTHPCQHRRGDPRPAFPAPTGSCGRLALVDEAVEAAPTRLNGHLELPTGGQVIPRWRTRKLLAARRLQHI